ncbi:IclR family transcriptional regulator [Variovorax sp. YR216]|uniref:IclR family transcriptional regulator n=1 Tax=Variovorax sp. YR216 TaxID=1882828 RepID=UPI00089622B8|nr:IclR family transcriptional regulator [Variovorax sp. YR216]SEB20034.1 transcriptional regulator, IclR family [Variovorax sp. YR216]
MSNAPPVEPGISRVPWTYADYEGDRQFASTLARGLELLRCFSPQQPLLGNKDLAQRMQLPRPTISRLVYTLVCMGYLAQDADSGKYRLGSAVLSLGFPLLETFPVRQRAREGMIELAQEFGGTVAIAVRDRLDMVCIEVVRASPRAGHPIDIGRTYTMCGTAVGRAYLAACTPQERQALLNQIQVKAPDQWARHRERLMQSLAAYPNTGCCVSVGEVYADVQAVAAPLGRLERGELAAINLSFQRRSLNERWLQDVVGPKLLALARRLN